MGKHRWLSLPIAAALVFFFTAHATAQTPELNSTSFQLERFEPMPGQGLNVLNLATSEVIPHDQASAGVFLHYVNDPLRLVREDASEEVVANLVESQLKAELWAGVGLHDMVDLGLVLPIVFYQDGDDLRVFDSPAETIRGGALSDLRIVPKLQIVDPDMAAGLGVAAVGTLFLPTGDPTTFNSDGALRFEPRFVVDYRHPVGLKVSGNLAYAFRPQKVAQNYVVDDVVRWGLGAQLPTGIPNFSAITSIFGDVQLEENRNVRNFQQAANDGKGSPSELLMGVQYDLPLDLVANVGGGFGLNQGVGAPDFRIFSSIGYTPQARDRDGDGIYDAEDRCPIEPEDPDGFEDQDGCPDHDNDGDGILDDEDQCRDEAEDADGFEDQDGCPEPDNDADGVLDAEDECPDTPGPAEKNGCPELDRDEDGLLDAEDQCPDDPEDKDGFEDEDGCPDPDNDADGIEDTRDGCPDEAEDKDGFEDEDGCPEPDNDRDGIVDEEDKCPTEPETINGVEDEDGCPDEGEPKVKVTQTKIEIYERVYFDTNKDSIKPVSYNILDQVARVLRANPQITRLQIEGHTDSRGSDAYNLDLSQRRAESVKEYLRGQGIDPVRLVAKGLGETTPIADNDTAAGRDRNRRVEFTILEVEGKPVSGDGPVTIEKKEPVEFGGVREVPARKEQAPSRNQDEPAETKPAQGGDDE